MSASEARSEAKPSEVERDGERSQQDGELAARRWAESGLLWLTGPPNGAPVMPSVALPLVADRALADLAALAPAGAFSGLGGAELLAERAAAYGFTRRGRTSAGGACRLLEARGGWLAVNLPRDDDARMLAAWLEDDALASAAAPLTDATWRALVARIAASSRDECVARARLLGLAVAPADPPRNAPASWRRIALRGVSVPPRSHAHAAPLVLDLSSLWAGPLAARLLRLAGARVIKLESTQRPDGARLGNARFYDLLNAGKQSVALDFGEHGDRGRLAQLLARADIVIESSRPRALAQLGVDAARWLHARPGRVWLSLTGYGRSEPTAEWVAFGDDAAAAAGLCWCVASEAPLFVGDAIADPLAGLHGALAALACWRSGESALLDISLRDVTAWAIAQGESPRPGERALLNATPPRLSGAPANTAATLGADTAAVLREFGIA